jgi:hypothetical protein
MVVNGWSGDYTLIGKEIPARLDSYLPGSVWHEEPVSIRVVDAASLGHGVSVVMDLACFVTGPIDSVLAKARGKLVCGTGPDPLPLVRMKLEDHGMSAASFSLGTSRMQVILRSIMASGGRRFSSGFLAGDEVAWNDFLSFAKLGHDSGICKSGVGSLEAILNLYAHCVPGAVVTLTRQEYAQVDQSWGPGRHALIGNRPHGGTRYRDVFPKEFDAEAARYEGRPSGKSVTGRPIMKVVSRVARHVECG